MFTHGLVLFLKLSFVVLAPRSGLAWKHSIDVGAGIIDADYRGHVGVILFNNSNVDFKVKVGDRIVQLILEKIVTPDVMKIEDFDETIKFLQNEPVGPDIVQHLSSSHWIGN
ncbi:hypothetical protein POTOM_047359 [Populus tomentosa]|uniref:Deoxyuridine 5'-triphosphate nucleotidohydrolase n=1 Tax=Populus tomentosa TaxID=118781 RepID=A0A8X8CDI6_POPTO|nr:hypothetical protein POTOM_047359 [Populus tomentosa]